jgi:hypothetical protein
LALIRGKEKTRFIILYNILERGSVLFLIAIVLHLTTSGLTRAVFISLAPITIILAAALLYFGHQEWLEDELMEMRRNIYSKN